MKERGILFPAPMVKAILAGQKTQTRRLMRPQPEPWPANPAFMRRGDDILTLEQLVDCCCPYGVPGDRLWVRETWGFDSGVRGDFRPLLGRHDLTGMDLLTHTLYRADGRDVPRWRPAIHMPRWASRITLEVTSVRAERLQAITEADAREEGVPALLGHPSPVAPAYREGFAQLWDAINGKRASWASSPWVWVVGFRRLP